MSRLAAPRTSHERIAGLEKALPERSAYTGSNVYFAQLLQKHTGFVGGRGLTARAVDLKVFVIRPVKQSEKFKDKNVAGYNPRLIKDVPRCVRYRQL